MGRQNGLGARQRKALRGFSLTRESERVRASKHIDWCEQRSLARGDDRCHQCRACTAWHGILGHAWDGENFRWVLPVPSDHRGTLG